MRIGTRTATKVRAATNANTMCGARAAINTKIKLGTSFFILSLFILIHSSTSLSDNSSLRFLMLGRFPFFLNPSLLLSYNVLIIDSVVSSVFVLYFRGLGNLWIQPAVCCQFHGFLCLQVHTRLCTVTRRQFLHLRRAGLSVCLLMCHSVSHQITSLSSTSFILYLVLSHLQRVQRIRSGVTCLRRSISATLRFKCHTILCWETMTGVTDGRAV